MKKKKGVRAYSLGGILLILLIVVLFGCGVLSVSLPQCAEKDKNVTNAVSTVKNAAPVDGVNIGSDTITGYYVNIRLKGLALELNVQGGDKSLANAMRRTGGFKQFKRSTQAVTVLVTFADVLYKEKPVFVSVVIPVNFPSIFWLGNNIVFEEDATEVRLSEPYYRYIVDMGYSFSSVKFMVLVGDEGFAAQKRGNGNYTDSSARFNITSEFYTKDLPPSVNDPLSPDFELGGGEGVNWLPSEEVVIAGLQALWNFLVKYWWAILAVGAVVLILGLLIKFIKWVKG